MTVASSISLQASAGFFCHKTEASEFILVRPPRTPHLCGTPARSRRWSLPHGRVFSEAADWPLIRWRKKGRWEEERAASPGGEAALRNSPRPAPAGRVL